MRYALLALLALTPMMTLGVYDLELADQIGQRAKFYGLDPARIVTLSLCESGLNPKAYSHDGGAEARGLWQITRKYHGEVSDKVAFDPIASTEWTLKRLVLGFFSEWSCWNML